MALQKVVYYFVRAGEMHRGITFLAVPKNTPDDLLIKLIKQKGIPVVEIKKTEKERT